MNLAETIYQHSLRLPEAAAREALDFIEFLEQRYTREANSPSRPAVKPRRQAGSARDVLEVIEEDEAHLNDFREYMP